MATVILQRHGRTTANASGVLAGRTPGVHLDDLGVTQAAHAAERLAEVPLVRIVLSPQTRCHETAEPLVKAAAEVPVGVDPRLDECDYGSWQGRILRDLASEDLWRVVQRQPSAARFPDGEALPQMQQRAVAAVREIDAEVEAEHGAGAVWLAVTHGDIIKAVLADAMGLHLDLFQRLHADPASLSVIRYGPERPMVLQTNTHAGSLAWLNSAPPSPDAAVGGGAGPQQSHP